MDMENRMYGLNLVNVSQVIFQYCELANTKNPFNKLTKMTGVDWVRAFLDRNRDITLRTSEAISIQHPIGFNRVKVAGLYDCLSSILFNDNTRLVPPSQIYKILTRKGKKGVSALTSDDQGKNVTALVCTSATGAFIPPMLIFSWVRFLPDLINNMTPIGRATKSG